MSLLSKTLSVAKKATESLVDAAGRKIDDVAQKRKERHPQRERILNKVRLK